MQAPARSLSRRPVPLFFAVLANCAPYEAAEDRLKGHVRVRRAREQGLVPCAALLEGLCRLRHHCGLAGGRRSGPQDF